MNQPTTKKLITGLLMLVLLLQVLPIRQAIKYFWVDNSGTEELVEVEKGATQNLPFFDDDHHWLLEDECSTLHSIVMHAVLFSFSTDEALPGICPSDIHTPPPNKYI